MSFHVAIQKVVLKCLLGCIIFNVIPSNIGIMLYQYNELGTYQVKLFSNCALAIDIKLKNFIFPHLI